MSRCLSERLESIAELLIPSFLIAQPEGGYQLLFLFMYLAILLQSLSYFPWLLETYAGEDAAEALEVRIGIFIVVYSDNLEFLASMGINLLLRVGVEPSLLIVKPWLFVHTIYPLRPS